MKVRCQFLYAAVSAWLDVDAEVADLRRSVSFEAEELTAIQRFYRGPLSYDIEAS